MSVSFAIGYSLPDEFESTLSLVRDFQGRVNEVYFALPGAPSGRAPLGMYEGYRPEEIRRFVFEELTEIRASGAKLTLLHNAACYGSEAASKTLADRIVRDTREAIEAVGITSVTTTSPYLARVLKERFPELELRASVNMRLGTLAAFRAAGDFFDGFYMQRDFNRDLRRIRSLRAWCDANGKRLYMLVNSGCLRFCPFQSFHDTLVAHEKDADPADFGMEDASYCHTYLRDEKNAPEYLRATWVRPEDLARYDGLFDGYKLATRLHPDPHRVIEAYINGEYHGNLCALTEPGFRELWLDNDRFPPDWFERTEGCGGECETCGYCEDVFRQVRCVF